MFQRYQQYQNDERKNNSDNMITALEAKNLN